MPEISDHKPAMDYFSREEHITVKQTLDLIWEISSDGLFITDKEGLIVRVNKSFSGMTGLSPEQVTGERFTLFFPRNDRDEAFARYKAELGVSENAHRELTEIVHTSGMSKFVELSGDFLYLNGACYGRLWFMHDVTELKNLKDAHLKSEQEILKVKEKAEESDRLKLSFLTNMSHEIRTPMNGIIGFSGMLLDPDLTEDKRKQFVEIIISSSNQLLELINDIIDLSKAEAGQLGINNREFYLNDLLEELLHTFISTAHAKGLGFSAKYGLGRVDSKIISDDLKLKQILQNLLSNALKFTSEGYIEFGYMIRQDVIEFYVKDTGIGIDPVLHNSIFERFRQIDDSNNRKYGGTGLGLPISKSLTELLGGRIWVDSGLNQGSTFYFAVPFHPISFRVEPVQQPTKSRYPDWSDKTLVIAEDEEINFFYLAEVLSPTGISILKATNGREAVDLVMKNDAVSLVLMDIKMPILDGYEATRIIKRDKPALPIIAQTAYAMSGDREIALTAGCDDYIPKPVKKDTLLAILKKYYK